MILREPFIILVIIFWALFPSFLPGQEVTISASETEGCDSLSVDFSYSTTLGNVTSVNWDFGNGTTSAEQNPAPVFYNEPGLYKVRLEINQSYFDEENILVRPSPNSFFAFSDTLEPGSYIVAFRAPPQLVDSFTYQYKWYFPGNTSYNTRWVTHQFDSAGITRVGLVVRDDFGCIDSTFRRIR
ncbi:MAG: PKD domain-containing protein, partial [Bacteroidota bacterium]